MRFGGWTFSTPENDQSDLKNISLRLRAWRRTGKKGGGTYLGRERWRKKEIVFSTQNCIVGTIAERKKRSQNIPRTNTYNWSTSTGEKFPSSYRLFPNRRGTEGVAGKRKGSAGGGVSRGGCTRGGGGKRRPRENSGRQVWKQREKSAN